ncbi:DUF3087 family protein [Colwelliaceae bacterium BS250]
MKLENIDKKTYRKHLNKIIVGFIITFMVLAVLFGQLFILIFAGNVDNNFWFNFSGVVLALIFTLTIINHFKHHKFMSEVYYVWKMKQQINYIYRKLKVVKKQALQESDISALIILSFYYKACRQLYTLDDNTITLSSLNRDEQELIAHLNSHNLTIDVNDYQQQLLTKV